MECNRVGSFEGVQSFIICISPQIHVGTNSEQEATLRKERHAPHAGEATEKFRIQLHATLKLFQAEQSQFEEVNDLPTSNSHPRGHVSCSVKGLTTHATSQNNGEISKNHDESVADEDSISSDFSFSKRFVDLLTLNFIQLRSVSFPHIRPLVLNDSPTRRQRYQSILSKITVVLSPLRFECSPSPMKLFSPLRLSPKTVAVKERIGEPKKKSSMY